METALKNCGLRLYTDHTCIFYSLQNVKFIETDLNYVFNNFLWMVKDNKLSIYFGEDKTKIILFKRGKKSLIKHNTKLKRCKTALSGGILRLLIRWKYVRIVLKKVNWKKKFLYRQRRYLSYPLKIMSCNNLIQLHYDLACCSWYPNLSISLKIKLQPTQNSCIR